MAAQNFLNNAWKTSTHLSCSTVTNKDELEGRDVAACFGHGCSCCGGVCGVNCAKSGRGEMSAAVGESSARKWQGSRRTHLFSREWGREGRVEWRGNEEVVLKN